LEITLIVAASLNGAIGKDNQLLWKLSDDLKNFRALTTDNVVVMGRKTYESIGKPLPNRINIVITRDTNLQIENVIVVHSVEAAIEISKIKYPEKDIFVIGGGEIYKQSVKFISKLILTKVNVEIEGDTYFNFNENDFEKLTSVQFEKSDKNEFDFEVITYKRKEVYL